MKSLKSIAQQKNLELTKLERVAKETDNLSPMNMGSTLLYSTDDTKALLTAYYERYTPVQSR